MLQSCGSESRRHDESSNPTASASAKAPVGSVVSAALTRWNRHPSLKLVLRVPSSRLPWTAWVPVATPAGALGSAAAASSAAAAGAPVGSWAVRAPAARTDAAASASRRRPRVVRAGGWDVMKAGLRRQERRDEREAPRDGRLRVVKKSDRGYGKTHTGSSATSQVRAISQTSGEKNPPPASSWCRGRFLTARPDGRTTS